jgi:hypothetical protein
MTRSVGLYYWLASNGRKIIIFLEETERLES